MQVITLFIWKTEKPYNSSENTNYSKFLKCINNALLEPHYNNSNDLQINSIGTYSSAFWSKCKESFICIFAKRKYFYNFLNHIKTSVKSVKPKLQ